MFLRVEKVVKIVNDLCESQKSRLVNFHPLIKVINTKCYKNSKKSCIFLFLGRLGWASLVNTENSGILLNNATFEEVFFYILIGNEKKKIEFETKVRSSYGPLAYFSDIFIFVNFVFLFIKPDNFW